MNQMITHNSWSYLKMNNWFRPSIQQPRWIKQGIDKLTFPMLYTQQVIKEYWDTWHKVFKPESKNEDKNI